VHTNFIELNLYYANIYGAAKITDTLFGSAVPIWTMIDPCTTHVVLFDFVVSLSFGITEHNERRSNSSSCLSRILEEAIDRCCIHEGDHPVVRYISAATLWYIVMQIECRKTSIVSCITISIL
jgi:hypothetical protein